MTRVATLALLTITALSEWRSCDETYATAYCGDPSGQYEFSAALDLLGELIDLRLKLHNPVARVTLIHSGQADCAGRPYALGCV